MMAASTFGRSTGNMISLPNVLSDTLRPPTFDGRNKLAEGRANKPLLNQLMPTTAGEQTICTEPLRSPMFDALSSQEQSMLLGTHNLRMKKYPKLDPIASSKGNINHIGGLDQATVTLKSQMTGSDNKVQISSQPKYTQSTKYSSNRAVPHKAHTPTQKNINLDVGSLKGKSNTTSKECKNIIPRVATFTTNSEEKSEYGESSERDTSYGCSEAIFKSEESGISNKNISDELKEAKMEFENVQMEMLMAFGLEHIPTPPECAKTRPQNLHHINNNKPLQMNKFILMLENM